jgi:thiosulfate/3-mercaptopyruvate sulfurtransferase
LLLKTLLVTIYAPEDSFGNLGANPMCDPKALISTAKLAASLGNPTLRVFDCTTYNDPPRPGVDEPYVPRPGRDSFDAGHVPGADFLDIAGEFSDRNSRLHFMMAPIGQLESAFSRHGIGEGSRVVLYSIGSMMWATRFWWMLRTLGFDNAAILDGGLDKWKAEGRPLENGPPNGYPTAVFEATSRPGLFVDKATVLASINKPGTVIVNALGPQFHQGLEPSRYGRPGSKGFTSRADAEAKFKSAGVTRDKRVIAYCGGGISATIDLFLLHQLGYENLMLYDGSMGEWAKDPSLPSETG